MLGGGFGRRGIVQDFIPSAVRIAKAVGRPVKTVWSREEDMRHDAYRPLVMARMTAGLGGTGLPLPSRVGHARNPIMHPLVDTARADRVHRQAREGFTEEMAIHDGNSLRDF